MQLKDGHQQQPTRIREANISEYVTGGNVSSYKKPRDQKSRQDEETLSQIEDLEQKLDQQMNGMYDQVQFGQDGSFGKEEDESSPSYLGCGNDSRKSIQM